MLCKTDRSTPASAGAWRRRWWAALALALPLTLPAPAVAAPGASPPLEPCRLRGVEHDARCGRVVRPLDPDRPDGPTIDVHFAVLPALARHKKPDPVFFFAGGPGQSAIELAGQLSRLMARLGNRRDVVLIDQRGTGRSAPLVCTPPDPTLPLGQLFDPQRQRDALERCRAQLEKLPHGDLRQYTTSIAMADADAVRRALGAEQVNLVGGSYGTRAVLEYLRLHPQAVRRAVIDGVAPPDMVLPAAIGADAQAAFDALADACEREAACRREFPDLRGQWRWVLNRLPREIVVRHPVTAVDEPLTLTPAMAAGLLRVPLYVPSLASALPLAIHEAARDRFGALFGLAAAMTARRGPFDLAEGMHFSVVCAEDMPRIGRTVDLPGADLGDAFVDTYRDACARWPRGRVDEAFYRVPAAPAAVLVMSGGDDPVTPPRHGERVTKALGAKARHVVVPHAGHGVLGIGCARDVLYRFIDAGTDAEALAVDASCLDGIPRPLAFQPVRPPASALERQP